MTQNQSTQGFDSQSPSPELTQTWNNLKSSEAQEKACLFFLKNMQPAQVQQVTADYFTSNPDQISSILPQLQQLQQQNENQSRN